MTSRISACVLYPYWRRRARRVGPGARKRRKNWRVSRRKCVNLYIKTTRKVTREEQMTGRVYGIPPWSERDGNGRTCLANRELVRWESYGADGERTGRRPWGRSPLETVEKCLKKKVSALLDGGTALDGENRKTVLEAAMILNGYEVISLIRIGEVIINFFFFTFERRRNAFPKKA